MVYKHAFFKYINVSALMLCMVKMMVKEEVGGHALNSQRNYIVDHVFEFLWKTLLRVFDK